MALPASLAGEGETGDGVVWYRLRADLRTRWRALALLAVLIGLRGGVVLTAVAAAGRWAWYLAAARLESAAPPVVPVAAIALIVPAALLAGNALAALPARAAARTEPGVALRRE